MTDPAALRRLGSFMQTQDILVDVAAPQTFGASVTKRIDSIESLRGHEESQTVASAIEDLREVTSIVLKELRESLNNQIR
jgi:hypothetical protein